MNYYELHHEGVTVALAKARSAYDVAQWQKTEEGKAYSHCQIAARAKPIKGFKTKTVPASSKTAYEIAQEHIASERRYAFQDGAESGIATGKAEMLAAVLKVCKHAGFNAAAKWLASKDGQESIAEELAK